jgi:hypothetical protein
MKIEGSRLDILLPQVLPVANPKFYKLHLACTNEEQVKPLDVFLRDRSEWDGWNRWRGKRDDFSRNFIFSLIEFYPEEDRWLFGGEYRVLSRSPVNNSESYEIELVEASRCFIGRLKIALKRPSRGKALNFENHYENLVVSEILPATYTGEGFPGYERINHPFQMLEHIFAIQKPDWKTALKSVKGIYAITDTHNGKRYVGSAYGNTGIWSRWSCYLQTGHGHYSDELTDVIAKNGIDYARKYFQFTLLEFASMKTDDVQIISREGHWKNVLLTRSQYGYNKN